MYEIKIKKKVFKNLNKMPLNIQKKFGNLVEDLQAKGPYLYEWPNYSKLGNNEYHCHLSKKWIACWYHEKESIIIEVYYAGSRENAPY